jgi:hypothetical protein
LFRVMSMSPMSKVSMDRSMKILYRVLMHNSGNPGGAVASPSSRE